jgi:hypothetical protein
LIAATVIVPANLEHLASIAAMALSFQVPYVSDPESQSYARSQLVPLPRVQTALFQQIPGALSHGPLPPIPQPAAVGLRARIKAAVDAVAGGPLAELGWLAPASSVSTQEPLILTPRGLERALSDPVACCGPEATVETVSPPPAHDESSS